MSTLRHGWGGYELARYDWDEDTGIGTLVYRHIHTGARVTTTKSQPGAAQILKAVKDRVMGRAA